MIWPATDDDILTILIEEEGGFVNNPNDSGGPTKYGITMATLAAWRGHPVTELDISALGAEEARDIYRKKYIADPGFDSITSVSLRAQLVDTSVLFGQQRAVEFLQTACGMKVTDGLCDDLTAKTANAQEARKLINRISTLRINRHIDRCIQDRTQIEFLRGWVNRAEAYIE